VGDIVETKLLGVPERDHHGDHLADLADLPSAFLEELDAFFTAYRMLEEPKVEVVEHLDRDRAVEALVTGG
jgi:inorganic pyrophosphatase